MILVRRIPVIVVVSSLIAALAVGGALAGPAPQASADDEWGPNWIQRTITPSSASRTFTVPETLDGLTVTVAGAPGRSDGGGAGAKFTFTSKTLTPGTVLDVRFGLEGKDGLFRTLSGGAGGTGSNANETGTRGGDATMLIARTSGDVCAQAAENVIAVAGGGGGASGHYESTSWLYSRIVKPTPGENSTFWNSGSPVAVRDSCRHPQSAGRGQDAKGSWYERWSGGGGGGGGLSFGAGGGAEAIDGYQNLNAETMYQQYKNLLHPAAGGEAGTSYLSPRGCANPFTDQPITTNTGQASVVFSWNELRTTTVRIDGLSASGVTPLGDTISGSVKQMMAWGEQAPWEYVVREGVVSAWIADRKVASNPVTSGRFQFDLASEFTLNEPVDVRIEFTPVRAGSYRPSSATAAFVAARTKPSFEFENFTRSDGSNWLVVEMNSYAPPSARAADPVLEITTRGPGESTFVSHGTVPTRSVHSTSCAVLSLGTATQEVTASFAGDTWQMPSTSPVYQYVPGDRPLQGTVSDSRCAKTTLPVVAPQSARLTAFAFAAGAEADVAADAATDADVDSSARLSWASAANTAAPGSTLSLALDVTHAGAATNEGVVDVLIDGLPVGSATPVEGRFALDVPAPTSGEHTLDAVYSDPADGTAEGSLPGGSAEQMMLLVTPEEVQIDAVVEGLDTAAAGDPVALRAEVTATVTTDVVDGEVAFFDDEIFVGVAPLVDGVASLDDVALDATSNTLNVAFLGDGSRWIELAETSAPAAYSVVPTSLTLTVSASTIVADTKGTMLVELAGGTPDRAATGGVSVFDGETELLELSDADAVPAADGVAAAWSVPLSSLPVGRLALQAVFTGDPGVASARSVSTTVDVSPRATSVAASVSSGVLDVAATVGQDGIDTDAAGARPWGAASVYRGDELVGTVAIVDGSAQLSLPASVVAEPDPAGLRIVFRPLGADLTGSETTAGVGVLSRTGLGFPPMAVAAIALLICVAGAVVVARTRAGRS